MSGRNFGDTLALLGVLSVFHIIGGAALGLALQRWRAVRSKGEPWTPPLVFWWGPLFGGMPLLFGLVTAEWGILAAQVVIFVASVAIAFWLSEPLKEALGRRYLFFTILGLVFMLVAALVSWLMLRGDSPRAWQALLFGGLFYAAGSLAFCAGLMQWRKARSSS